MRKTIPIFLLILAVAGPFIMYSFIQRETTAKASAKVISVTAKLGGDNGSMISVGYQTDKIMDINFDASQAYLIVESSERRLNVQYATYIGPLISKSLGQTSGWFVIDNSDMSVTNGTYVTIAIGDFRQNNYQVTWP
jgi:hypothetical protein